VAWKPVMSGPGYTSPVDDILIKSMG
jgi:hypothetical protein